MCFGKGQTWPLFEHKSILCFGQRAKLFLVTNLIPPKTQKNVIFGQAEPFLVLKIVWLLHKKKQCVFYTTHTNTNQHDTWQNPSHHNPQIQYKEMHYNQPLFSWIQIKELRFHFIFLGKCTTKIDSLKHLKALPCTLHIISSYMEWSQIWSSLTMVSIYVHKVITWLLSCTTPTIFLPHKHWQELAEQSVMEWMKHYIILISIIRKSLDQSELIHSSE